MARNRHHARKPKPRNRNDPKADAAGEQNTGNENKEKVDKYDTIVKENLMFVKYYKQLDLVDEKEFDEMVKTFIKPLPISFRITSYKNFSQQILTTLKEKHFKYIDEITKEKSQELTKLAKGASLLTEEINDEENTEIYKCLPWYPNEMAWQVNLSRQDVRKNIHFDEFKKFLIHQTENGNLNRQEAVSMIPPLLLDIKSHHKVSNFLSFDKFTPSFFNVNLKSKILDMCAAPGSKTAQLIESLHKDESNPIPEGFVIANDLDNKRCYMLMHQLKRLESPNFMIINHDASSLPNLREEVCAIKQSTLKKSKNMYYYIKCG